jgi:molecular chaperone GrpE
MAERTTRDATTTEEPLPAVADQVTELQARAEAAEQQRDEYLTLLKQTRADFENYQKRNARERESERKYAFFPLALELLPAIDNLERAIAAAKQAGDQGPLAQGVTGTHRQLLDVLKRHNVMPIEALGQPFDPNKHQAVMQQPSADRPPGTVLQVLQQGFMIHDRVLRPASVVVSTQTE